MTRYKVTARLPGAGNVQSFLDHATSEADAMRQFREARPGAVTRAKAANLDMRIQAVPLEAELPAEPLASPPETVAATPDMSPAPAEAAAEVDSATEVEPAPSVENEETVAAPSLDDLKAHGVGDNDIVDLRAAGLETVAAVIEYAKRHNGLTSIGGIGPAGETKIKRAIMAVQGKA